MNPTTGEVVSGVDGYFARFPTSADPELLFHSMMVYCLATPDRSGTGDRQIPYLGSPLGGVFAEIDKSASAANPIQLLGADDQPGGKRKAKYGDVAQFLTADILLGFYDGDGLVWVMDHAALEKRVQPGAQPEGIRPGVVPFVAFTDPPAEGQNIRLLIARSQLGMPLNGVIIRGSGLGAKEVKTGHYFIPTDHRHVSHHRGKGIPRYSTRVHDINQYGEIDEDVWGGLDKLCVVMPQGGGCAKGNPDEYTLALNYAAKTGPGYGITVYEESGGLPPGHSAVPPKLQTVMAYQAYARKGPSTAGHPTNDKHKQADTPEGAINSAHDHGERFVYKNIEMDGPELFEEVHEPPVGEGVIPLRVHKQWKGDDTHEGPCGPLPGRWREHVKVLAMPVWDEPATKEETDPKEEPGIKGEVDAKDEPDPKEEAAVKEEAALKGKPPEGPDEPAPKGKPKGPNTGKPPGGPKSEEDEEDPIYYVFYDPAWHKNLPEIKIPDYGGVNRPDSEGGTQGSAAAAAAAVANTIGEWQGLPEINPGNAETPGGEPPSDVGPLELRRHSIEFMARPNLSSKPTLRIASAPPAPPPGLSAMGAGDPQREQYMNEVSDWYHDNMLAGVTGESWDAHAKAPVSLHATAFAKVKPSGFDYNTRAQFTRSRDFSRPRKYVTGTADGGVVYHPHEIKHWMLGYGYDGDDLPASVSQPEVMHRKGVRLSFMEGLKADDESRGVSGMAIEQTGADDVVVSGVDDEGVAAPDKLFAFDVMVGAPQFLSAEIMSLANMRGGAIVYNIDTNRLEFWDDGEEEWVQIAPDGGGVVESDQTFNSTTMAAVAGMSVNVQASTLYRFEADIVVTGADSAGIGERQGIDFDFAGGSATITSTSFGYTRMTGTTPTVVMEVTSLDTDIEDSASNTKRRYHVTGYIHTNASGTIIMQASANAGSSAPAAEATVHKGSWMRLEKA